MTQEELQITKARSLYYSLLGICFSYQGFQKHIQLALSILDQIFANPINDQTQKDAHILLQELEAHGFQNIQEEFETLFIDNFSHKAINLTASYYDEGWEFGEKCLRIRDLILESEFRKDENFIEPEDHLGFLLIFNASLLNKANPCSIAMAKQIFADILNDYVNFVILEILKNKKSKFYKSIAKILGSFAEFERLYLEVTPPPFEEFIDLGELKKEERKGKWKKRIKTQISEEEIKYK
ncbi:TorD/DmsD family molecular chaperone [Helicobacter kayseriensis]|uniref:TorD/DmsD family molecular chaperone n=1 Tax=Helicobacter kayseriensis TaxID=2905877 RepID=UPI001E64F1E8|nr:molecular chaperone TorD family protein [Helicobacter kayseriensis]MCE3047525.1 molecular chaperone TorD family protein [Helicobacter kayseriensis]MCE3048847.1 molecular chaperone TorD family protein [Helicobacter kayseriensis]